MNLFSIRVELFFLTQRIEPSFNMTQKILSTFQRFELFFEYDSKNRPFFLIRLKKIEIFGWQKIELFPMNYDSKNWTFSPKMCKVFLRKNDSKNGTFLKIWLIELNFSNKNMTQIIEPFLLWLGDLIFLRLKELNFSSNMAQRIEFLFSMSQRVGVFLLWLKELIFFNMSQRIQLFFQIRRKELHPFFEYDAKNWTLFSLNTTQRIESFVFEYDAKNWILFFFEHDAKNWKLCLKRLGELNLREKLLKDSNPFFWMRLKNWNFLSEKIIKTLNSLQKIMTQRMELFVNDS